MSGYYSPPDAKEQYWDNWLADVKRKADEVFDRVMAVTGSRKQADDAWTEAMNQGYEDYERALSAQRSTS